MTATRETIEKDEHRLVTPEPENKTEAPILEAIERHYCQFDNAHFAFTANWIGWVASNDISKDHLYQDLGTIIAAAQAIRANIARLKERRIREPDDVLLEQSANAIRKVTDEMVNEGYDCRDLPRQIERIEEKLQSLRVVFELTDY